MKIRVAKPSDAEAIVRVHYAAVQTIPDERYSMKVKEAWSPLPDEARFAWMRQIITQGEQVIMVAEDDGEIIGFGIVNPPLCELRALYVIPSSSGRGIGRLLLQELESRSIEHGIRSLRLNASLNAEAFYQHNGYRSLQHGTFRLSADQHMACVKMEKDL